MNGGGGALTARGGILGASPQVREAEVERSGGACGIPATWTRKEAESSPARRPFPGGPLLLLRTAVPFWGGLSGTGTPARWAQGVAPLGAHGRGAGRGAGLEGPRGGVGGADRAVRSQPGGGRSGARGGGGCGRR